MVLKEYVLNDAEQAFRQFPFRGHRHVLLRMTGFMVENYRMQAKNGFQQKSAENHQAYGGIVVSNFNPLDNGGKMREAYIVQETKLSPEQKISILDTTFTDVLRENMKKDGAITLSGGVLESVECTFDSAISDVLYANNAPTFDTIAARFIDEPFMIDVDGKPRANFGVRTQNAICLPQVGGGRTSLLRQSNNEEGVPKGVYQFADTGLRRKIRPAKVDSLPSEVQKIADEYGFVIESTHYMATPKTVEPVERAYMPIPLVKELQELYQEHIRKYLRPRGTSVGVPVSSEHPRPSIDDRESSVD